MLKKYIYFLFCFFVLFSFQNNVLGVNINGYDRDCSGNVVPSVEHVPGNNSSNSSSNESCSLNVDSDVLTTHKSTTEKIPENCKASTSNVKNQNRNIILIIDDSGSMLEGKKIEKVRAIFKAIAQQVHIGDVLKIRYFSGKTADRYDFDALNTSEKRNIKAKSVLGKLKEQTNTNFVDAVEDTIEWINNQGNGKVPIVYFITDGYPTEEGIKKLGYTSSAQYFYGAANAFNSLKQTLDKNHNAKFVTIGLGLDGNSSKSINYILNPTKDNRELLKKITADEKDKIEDYKFAKMIQGESIGENENLKKEFIFSVASNPDIAMTGYTDISDGGKTIRFSKNSINSILANVSSADITTITNKGFVIGPVYNVDKNDIYVYVGAKKVQFEFKRVSDNKRFIYIKGEYFNELKKNRLTVKLNKSKAVKNYNIGVQNNPSRLDLDGMVNKYYSINNSGDVKDIELDEIASWVYEENTDTDNSNNSYEKNQVIYTHNGVSEERVLQIGTGYVSIYDMNNTSKAPEIKRVSLQVKYLVDLSYSLNPGTLSSSDNFAYPGGGFKFQDIILSANGKWTFKSFADDKSTIPIIQYKENDSSDWVNINYDAVFYDSNAKTKLFSNVNDLKNKISSELVEYIDKVKNKSVLNFKALDSSGNNPNEKSKIETDSSIEVNEAAFNVVITYKVKKACQSDTSFEYIDDKAGCSNGYSSIYNSVGSDYSYIEGESRYYFVPFNYSKKEFDVDISLNNYKTVCKIKVTYNPDNPGYVPTPPFDFKKNVSYRSIDVTNPFPRANDMYASIPINWRYWVCTGVGTDGKCLKNADNLKRLENSYSQIYYSKTYNSSELTAIAKDTLNSPENYYSSWDNINILTGKSSEIDKLVDTKFSSTIKSYCKLGYFSKDCDGVMTK